MIKRLALLLLLAPLLGGCDWKTVSGSVAGTECKFMERPPYAVLGKRSYDQDWIDNTIEGAVGACRWKRPALRPPELDAQPGYVPPAKPVAPKRKKLRQRIKEKIWPAAQAAPVIQTPIPEIRPVTPAQPDPPPAPPQAQQSPIDALLHRRK